jgi:hypothetical protein
MTDKIDYNTDLEYLLKIHAEECESFSILHRYSYEKYNERSNYINIPVIILSSAIGFATGIDIGYDKMNIILGVSSIFVGIIKSIDTYFQLGKRSESHRLCSLQFQQINKKIMIELSLKREQRISAKDMLQIIKTDIKNLQDIAPLIDDEIVKIFKKNYGEPDAVSGKITFNAHTPNLCNGLTEVTVNGDRITNEPDNKNGSGNGGGGGDGDNNKRRRRSSRERRRSRGSSPDSFGSKGDDDDNDDGRGGGGAGVGSGGGGGRSSRNSRNSRNGGGGGSRGGGGDNSNKKNDGNVSSASNSSGFMSSVSNFIKGGVNLITGNRSRPASASSNSTSKVESQEEYRERRRRNNKENSSEVNGAAGVLSVANAVNSIVSTPPLLENVIKQQITNEIVELTDAFSYSGQQVGNSQNKQNASALSTPTSSNTPMVQMNNMIQSGALVQRPEPHQVNSEQLQQLQQLQNLQQFFNSQRQTPVPNPNPTATPAPLPIPQLVAQASTPRISTPVVLPSSASNKSNTSNIKLTDNVLKAVSASLVYAGVNTNGSQNITPATSKPASVKSEVEPIVVPHHQFMRNVTIPGIGNIYESDANNNNVNDNVIIDILPLTHDNLSMHENSMIQQQEQQQEQQEQHHSAHVEIPITATELPNKIPILPLVFDEFDPEGMM